MATSSLSSEEKEQLHQLLEQNRDVFAFNSKQLGRTGIVQHVIDTGDSLPIRQRPYRVGPATQKEINSQIEEMLANDVIQPSVSPWASPVILVTKKDGKKRFCIDFRKLNAVTSKDSYPLPRTDDTLDRLQGTRYFSTLDLMSGYWQCEMHESSREKTAFITYGGLYEFKVLPFGLCNAPSTFQRSMESVLGDLKWKVCVIYLDDIIVFSKTFEEHLEHLSAVFDRFREANIRLKPSKCTFGQSKVTYLGHIISRDGIQPDPEKVRLVQEFPVPRTVKHVRGCSWVWPDTVAVLCRILRK